MTFHPLANRALVWLLASSSFACLLGTMWGWWPMRGFAGCILLPCLLALAFLAMSRGGQRSGASTWIIEGTLGGIVAAIVYDLFRLPFVLHGLPLFAVFPRFGELLLGDTQPRWLVQVLGWTYHFSNGAALGIMLLAMLPDKWRTSRRALVSSGVAWALGVETILLLVPYYSFFKLHLPFATFLAITLSAHVVFGLSLGWWLSRRPAVRAI